jgi:hypothetical protein
MPVIPAPYEVHFKQYRNDTPQSILDRLELLRAWEVDQVVVESLDVAKAAESLGLKVVLAKSFFDSSPVGSTNPAAPTVEMYFKKYDADTPDAISQRLQLLKQWGVGQVVVETMDVAQTADSLALKVVLANWWGVSTPDSEVAGAAQAAASIKNLTDVKMDDEPIYWESVAEANAAAAGQPFVPQYTPARFQQVRDLFIKNWPAGGPPRPSLSISFYGPEDEWTPDQQKYFVGCLPAVDMLRLNMYPYDDPNELRQIWDWIWSGRRYQQQAGVNVPIITTLQAWSFRKDQNGQFMMPSAAELRVMGYQALLAGCQAVSFYQFEPDTWANVPNLVLPSPIKTTPKVLCSFTDSMAALIAELASVAAALAGATVDACMSPEGLLRAHIVNATEDWIVNVNTSHMPYLLGTDTQAMIQGLGVSWFPYANNSSC